MKQNLKSYNTSTPQNDKKTSMNKKDLVIIDVSAGDTVFFADKINPEGFIISDVKFSGYDKHATANKESIHIVNGSSHTLKSVSLEIIYKDMNGRMLHSREIVLNCDIPPSETRKIDFPTWDSQHSFYYYRSNEPKRAASPYKIQISPRSFTILHSSCKE